MYKNQKIKNLEAEIFCYAPSKQEHSPASILDKVLNIRARLHNKSNKSLKIALPNLLTRISFHYEYASAVMIGLIFLGAEQRNSN